MKVSFLQSNLMASFILFCVAGVTMASEHPTPENQPPLSPESEVSIRDEAFVDECLSNMKAINERMVLKLDTKTLTRSEKWGTVLRVDFDVRGTSETPGVNRIICWRGTDGRLTVAYAVGQGLAR